MKNNGIRNEYMFIQALNDKKINEINFLLQELILYLFPHIRKDTVIKCYKNIEYEKGDICIKVGMKVKYISIKMGIRNSIHCESIEKFKKFLINIDIKENTIKEILKYQYADGTIDGSGKNRKTSSEYKLENEDSILLINKEINDVIVLRKIIKRFLIQGTQWHSNCIDVLIYGTPNDFFWITKREIYDYLLSKKDVTSSSIHFSCLTFQPMARVLDYNENMEYRRHWIQIKWYNIEDNIIEIMNERVKKHLNN